MEFQKLKRVRTLCKDKNENWTWGTGVTGSGT